MSMEVGYIAVCPECYSDMGTVWETETDFEEVPINNAQLTAHVSNLPCPSCGVTVFRVQRIMQAVIRT